MDAPGSGPRKALPPASTMLLARDAEEMRTATADMKAWFDAKVEELRSERDELMESRNYAKAHKWRVTGFDAAIRRAEHRWLFYRKCAEAVGHGYAIIPDLPCELIAIRTSQEKPSGGDWSRYGRPSPPTQGCEILPAAEGEYVSPTPKVWRTSREIEEKGEKRKLYECEATEFVEPLFPVKMAHPALMTAAANAMSLKLFDEIGISPPYSRKAKDPAIVGMIHLPEGGRMTFLIAWYLNLKDLP